MGEAIDLTTAGPIVWQFDLDAEKTLAKIGELRAQVRAYPVFIGT